MQNRQYKIVLTGAESTGKSTLAEGLANRFNGLYIPEFARGYIETLGRKYQYADIEFIARKQINIEKQIGQSASFVFFDTWLIITKVWFDFVYGKHPKWLHNEIASSKVDLFLVCDIDMPWVYDSVRENGGENRKKLHHTYLNEIEKYGFEYRIVSSLDQARLNNAIAFVEQIIQ